MDLKHVMRKEKHSHTSLDSSCIRISAIFCACAMDRKLWACLLVRSMSGARAHARLSSSSQSKITSKVHTCIKDIKKNGWYLCYGGKQSLQLFFPLYLSQCVCVCVSQSLLALYVNKIHACELVECFWSDWILLCRCRHYVEKESERERKMRIPKYNEMLFMSLFACDCVCVWCFRA